MIEIKAGNALHRSGWLRRNIAKFSRATAPANVPYLRPAGNEEIDYFGLKQVVHVLIKVSFKVAIPFSILPFCYVLLLQRL